MIGKTFGHYRIEAQLGEGGMGVVYRAHDMRLGRDVALKFISESSLAKKRPQEQLLNEARAASALNHPNVAHIYDVGEIEGRGYIAMEYVRGQSLSVLIAGEGLPVETVARYGVQIADALAHAHEHGVVHCDLKSANVVITPEGRAKVLDFGVASRLWQEELAEATKSLDTREPSAGIAGTLHYMAPELLRAQPPDQRSDIWALGVLLYQMVAGALPFRGKTGFELTSAILREPPAAFPDQAPPSLRAIIQHCLTKEPGQRYQSASEVRAALDALRSSTEVVPVAGRGEGAPSPWPRRILIWGFTLAVVLGLIVWKGGFFPRAPQKAAPASAPRLSTGGKPSANAEANEYYNRAMLFTMRRLDIPHARQLLEHALQLDPKFASARASHGFTYVLAVQNGASNDRSLLYKAEEELRQALLDEPDLSQAHAQLGAVCVLLGRKELAFEEARKSLQLSPDNLVGTVWLSLAFYLGGDYSTAKKGLQKIQQIDPLFWPAHWMMSQILAEEGQHAEAAAEAQKVFEQDPTNLTTLLTLSYHRLTVGDLRGARAFLEEVPPEFKENYRFRLGLALASAREGSGTRALDEQLLKHAEINPFSTLTVAEYYALRGDSASALDWLDRAVRNGDERAEWFQRDPLLANIRKEPRFQQILNSIAFRRQQHGK